MLIPPFHGLHVWRAVDGLTDKDGLVLVNDFQQNPTYPDIFAVGVAVSIPPFMKTPLPMGLPKTGYFIESMGTAAVQNLNTIIMEKRRGKEPENIVLHSKPTMNALCITDFGDNGAVFVTMPQIPPRKHDWTIHGKVATLAKIAFEKYFMHKVDSGDTDPYYEKYFLMLIGIERT